MSDKIKTDEKKQHFDDIYVQTTPVAYKTEILDTLEYVSDDSNRHMFDRLVLPWIRTTTQQQDDDHPPVSSPLHYVDVCACFGNTTMATVYGMTYTAIATNWADVTACETIQAERRFPCTVTAVDISANAMAYGKRVGLYDTTIVADLNDTTAFGAEQEQVRQAMATADVVVSTAALVYLDLDTVERIVTAFAHSKSEGYILVNFLSPFALDKSDATKRLLVQHLDFVGSMAARHRKLSPLEQQNYPGETWALLEVWVLKRKQQQSPP